MKSRFQTLLLAQAVLLPSKSSIMKNLEKKHFIGLWKSQDMAPNWNYNDGIEMIIYSYDSFSIRVEGGDSLLAEGRLEVQSLEEDAFEFTIDGHAVDEMYLNFKGQMYMADGSVPPSFVLIVPKYGERFFIQTRQ